MEPISCFSHITDEKAFFVAPIQIPEFIKQNIVANLDVAAEKIEIKSVENEVIFKCQDKGLILFWLLFEGKAIRITPPLTISEEEIKEGCALIIEALDEIHLKG